ncbi:hypothetical protein [Methylobacter tundripaludum]|uniref:hypothetical protein n=1 Tax=Methylobacter tundripaludum TaxID=173365 RepID=UPI00123769B8|nr:hypothetical protein [Methylobacter tundripaludum]
MTDFTCPECDGELEGCGDGMICYDCHAFVDSSQLAALVEADEERNISDQLDGVTGLELGFFEHMRRPVNDANYEDINGAANDDNYDPDLDDPDLED